MSRDTTPKLVWEADDEGERAGAYTVQLEAPGEWRLTVKDRSIGIYPTKTAALHAATGVHRRLRLRRKLVGSLLVTGVSVAALGIALAGRLEPNPNYPPARAIADRFDRAQLLVEEGQIAIDQVAQMFPGIEGASFEHAGRLKLGLAGTFDGACYGMVWRSGYRIGGVVVRHSYVSCRPDPSLIDQPDPPGLAAEPMHPAWVYTLPDVNRTRVWFIPLVTIAIGLMLAAASRAITLLLALRR